VDILNRKLTTLNKLKEIEKKLAEILNSEDFLFEAKTGPFIAQDIIHNSISKVINTRYLIYENQIVIPKEEIIS